jgi:hypothetical protein
MALNNNSFFFDGQDVHLYPGNTSVSKWITSLTGVKHPEAPSLLYFDDALTLVVYALSLEHLHLYATKEAPHYAKSFFLTAEVETPDSHNSTFFTNFKLFHIAESYDDFLSNLIGNSSLRELEFVDYHIDQDLLEEYMMATEYSDTSFPDSTLEDESSNVILDYVFQVDA